MNDFIIPYEGIDLINTNSTGFYIYGAGELHGARLVTLHEADPTAYETQMLYYKDLIGTKLPFGFAGTWGAYVQGIVLLAVGALVLVGAGVTVLVVRLVKKSRNKKESNIIRPKPGTRRAPVLLMMDMHKINEEKLFDAYKNQLTIPKNML